MQISAKSVCFVAFLCLHFVERATGIVIVVGVRYGQRLFLPIPMTVSYSKEAEAETEKEKEKEKEEQNACLLESFSSYQYAVHIQFFSIHIYPFLSISRIKSFSHLSITPMLSTIVKPIDEQFSMFIQNTLPFFCDMLLVDKQRPKTLEEMDYHKDMSINLMKLVFCFCEALFRRHHPMSFHICCFMVLRAVGRKPASWRYCVKCSDRVQKRQSNLWFDLDLVTNGEKGIQSRGAFFTFSMQTPSQKSVEIVTIASNYHIELNPSDVGIYDYVVVQEIIKEIAQYKQLDANAKHPFKGISIPLQSLSSGSAERGRQFVSKRSSRSSSHDGEVLQQLPPHSLL